LAPAVGDEPSETPAVPKFDFADAVGKYAVQVQGASSKCQPSQIDLLKWTNPIRGTAAGSVFLWTLDGMPQAACCMYAYRMMEVYAVDHELVSLATQAVEARYDGEPVWRCEQPGIAWLAASGAPAPAASRSARLVQMRNLATSFQGYIGTPTSRRQELRLLPQPIYRFPVSAECDGGVFAFAHTTDPEILLLVRSNLQAEQPTWEFAAVRMTLVHAFLTRGEKVVWSVEWWNKNRDTNYVTRARVPFSVVP
jgi:hypothetical protein